MFEIAIEAVEVALKEGAKAVETSLMKEAKEIVGNKQLDLADLDKPIAKRLDALKDGTESSEKLDKSVQKEVEGNILVYNLDENGDVKTFHAEISKVAPENERDGNAQKDVVKKFGIEGDEGGHLLARIFGGGSEKINLEPMRSCINHGPYNSAEIEMREKGVKEGNLVTIDGEVYRDTPGGRPLKIQLNFSYNGVTKELVVDNVINSQELLKDEVKNIISTEDYKNLLGEINDMIEDGHEVSVISVLKDFANDGNVKELKIGLRDETDKENTYKTIKVNN